MFTEKWNENWLVWKETNAFRLVSLPPMDALQVDLPYDAAFHQQQDPNSPNEGKTGFLNGGTWHYAKEYYAPESERGMTIRLLFEGCAQKTYVFVNDSLAGECHYAYSTFEVDISSYLRYGATNRIVVTTTTLDLSSRFYCGCGIYRDVYLCKGGDVYLEPGRLQVTTKAINDGDAYVRIDAPIVSQVACATEGVLQLSLCEQDGKPLWQADYPVHLPGRRTHRFSRHFTLSGITPWDAEQPVLYHFQAKLVDQAGRLIDEETVCTGFRTIQADGKNGLQINGKTVKLLGGCIHHDQGILGAETYDEYE